MVVMKLLSPQNFITYLLFCVPMVDEMKLTHVPKFGLMRFVMGGSSWKRSDEMVKCHSICGIVIFFKKIIFYICCGIDFYIFFKNININYCIPFVV